jgi:hypothetical protein
MVCIPTAKTCRLYQSNLMFYHWTFHSTRSIYGLIINLYLVHSLAIYTEAEELRLHTLIQELS